MADNPNQPLFDGKRMLVDESRRVIPQYYNPDTETFYPMTNGEPFSENPNQELFTSKRMIVDDMGRPIPQFYDPDSGFFFPVTTDGGGGGGGPLPSGLVRTVNLIAPDANGNVSTDFKVIDALGPDVPPKDYPLGSTEFYSDYEPSDYEQYIMNNPSLNQLQEGQIAVRTFMDANFAYQQIDNVKDGVFKAAYVRASVDSDNWGELVAIGAGATGPQGPIGPIGPQGPEGPIGSAGQQGEIGPVGVAGPQGPKGETGDTGIVGPQGSVGDQGPVGPSGPVGPMGPTGANGIKGDKGEKGDQGEQGVAGPGGGQGNQGVVGPQGPQGPQGEGVNIGYVYESVADMQADIANVPDNSLVFIVSGPGNPNNGELYSKIEGEFILSGELEGIQGPQGPQGVQGPEGPIGSAGQRGLQGLQGIKGDIGETGPRGKGVVLKGRLADEGFLPENGDEGDAYWVGPALYIWTDDPAVIEEPGWLIGTNLQGPAGANGSNGAKGDKGDKGDTGSTPTLLDATTTTKGVMQVGDGLLVSSGVVSLNKIGIGVTNAPVDIVFEDLLEGYSSKSVTTSTQDQIFCLGVLNTLLGTNYTGASLRFYSEVFKAGANGYQRIDVFCNNDNTHQKLFEIYRQYVASTWQNWRIIVLELGLLQSPQNSIAGLYGSLARDLNTNILYINKGSKTGISSNAWVALNAPKEHLIATRITTAQSISALGTKLIFNSKLGGSLDLNNSTGDFTLKAGRTYKISFNAGFTFTATNGWIGVALYLNTGSVKQGPAALWYSSNAGVNEISSGPYEYIITPATDNIYSLRSFSINGTANMRLEYCSLTIHEI